jgi:hypothetical protein
MMGLDSPDYAPCLLKTMPGGLGKIPFGIYWRTTPIRNNSKLFLRYNLSEFPRRKYLIDLLTMLREERAALEKKIGGIDAAIHALNGDVAADIPKKRTWKMSAAARAKISAAQKKRWARAKK